MTSTSDLKYRDGTADPTPEPTGFRWYLRSSLPVSWLAKDVMPTLAYLRETERMPVVNIRRGWLHGTHLEVIAHSDDGRAVPWPLVIARLRAPGEEASAPHTEEAYLARARELGRLEQRRDRTCRTSRTARSSGWPNPTCGCGPAMRRSCGSGR